MAKYAKSKVSDPAAAAAAKDLAVRQKHASMLAKGIVPSGFKTLYDKENPQDPTQRRLAKERRSMERKAAAGTLNPNERMVAQVTGIITPDGRVVKPGAGKQEAEYTREQAMKDFSSDPRALGNKSPAELQAHYAKAEAKLAEGSKTGGHKMTVAPAKVATGDGAGRVAEAAEAHRAGPDEYNRDEIGRFASGKG